MKKIIIIISFSCLIGCTFTASSQPVHEIKHSDTTKLVLITQALQHNAIKINFSALAFQNYSVSYERLIKNKVSMMVTYRYMPFTNLPFQQNIANIVSNNNINFNQVTLGNDAITAELRIYAHKNMSGFYMAPYGRYANFNLSIPIQYTFTQNGNAFTKEAVFSGNIQSYSGGLLLGFQKHLSKLLLLDIWLIGAHFGNGVGSLNASFSPPLSPQEEASLQNNLNNINGGPFTVKGTVTNNSTANLNLTGPWLGIRALGINLGIAF
ncbi:MAG: DUF3575 domain-containing protein [Bacteroidota bacterium]|jgi:hypothetical protein|nr:DUF3575 domain-containing protein [Bacteroidota bacterium]